MLQAHLLRVEFSVDLDARDSQRAMRHRRRRLPMRDRLRQRRRLVELGLKAKGK